jgi:hypothetical protein
MRLKLFASNFLLTMTVFLVSASGLCRTDNEADLQQFQTAGFHQHYIKIGLLKNSPASVTEDEFETGKSSFHMAYQHYTSRNWLMGVGFSYKNLTQRKTGQELPTFTLIHEGSYLFRLYHPTYLLLGGKFLYLYPSLRPSFPPQRNKQYPTQMGVALAIGLTHQINKNDLLTLELNRWKGTANDLMHGIEIAFSLSHRVK